MSHQPAPSIEADSPGDAVREQTGTPTSSRSKYSQLDKEELLDLLILTEMNSSSISNDNYALIEQVNQSQRDIAHLQAELAETKSAKVAVSQDILNELERVKTLLAERESEIIFLEDHARFSTEQTKLSIAHWDLLLKNRDENIELLSQRLSQTTATLNEEQGGSTDKYKCLLERYRALHERFLLLCGDSSPTSEDETRFLSGDKVFCPWKNQADVRVAQLERVTSQLNATYEQLHAKSDELLLINRSLGTMRKKNFDLENKLKKYKSKWFRSKRATDSNSPSPPESGEEFRDPIS